MCHCPFRTHQSLLMLPKAGSFPITSALPNFLPLQVQRIPRSAALFWALLSTSCLDHSLLSSLLHMNFLYRGTEIIKMHTRVVLLKTYFYLFIFELTNRFVLFCFVLWWRLYHNFSYHFNQILDKKQLREKILVGSIVAVGRQ